VLASGQYHSENGTELLLHFDAEAQPVASGAWEYSGSVPVVSDSVRAMGGGSAAFTGAERGVALVPPSGSLFSTGAAWTDFTIEFWLYPATLSNGETIMAWEGSLRDAGRSVPQGIRVSLRDRKVVWEFRDLFVLHSGKRLPVRLAGTRQILPRAWHHHLLRFQSATGLLEYTLTAPGDRLGHRHGTRRATWRTEGRHEHSARGPGRRLPFRRASALTQVRGEPMLPSPSDGQPRIVHRRPGPPARRPIEAVTSQPGDSAAQFSCQVPTRGQATDTEIDNDCPFRRRKFPDSVHGRYVQIMVELFRQDAQRDPASVQHPHRLDPTCHRRPAELATGHRMITLSWRRSTESGVRYMVYWRRPIRISALKAPGVQAP
jgi:hypothetical protein